MTDALPPAAPVLAAAVLTPLVPLPVRRALGVAAPLVGLVVMYRLPPGEALAVEFLGRTLVWARTDALSLLFGLVFLASAALAALYGWHRTRAAEQSATLWYVGGALAVVFAGDLLTLLVAWEVMAVASTVVVLSGGKAASGRAGQRYLLVHLAAGAALLLGVVLITRSHGDVAFGELWGFGAASWLVLAAFCVNAAVPPLHAWLPDAYPEASVSGSVFLSAFTTKAAVYCLLRAFAGSELLVWGGVAMALYGVLFAVLQNDMRRLLAYHIVSQVGYMVCGVGIGTATALNGAAAHAFCHIFYKALLFMGAGALVHATGKEKLSALGGLARAMPLALGLYMIGALSISGAPLFNGFVSKSLVVAGAAEDGRGAVALLLALASVGTFLSTGLKLPYFAWLGPAPGRTGPAAAREAPPHMLAAMTATAALCVALGVAPAWLYRRLPFPPVAYEPYTAAHVFETLLLLVFTALAFWWVLDSVRPHRTITLDTDWLYRRGAAYLVRSVAFPLDAAFARLGGRVARVAAAVVGATRNPSGSVARLFGRAPDAPPRFDEDMQRLPIGSTILWTLMVFAVLGLWLGLFA